MSKLKDKLAKGEFVITSEIGPPKGTNIEPHLKEADHLASRVDAINVTDLQSSVMLLGSLAVCRLLVERGLEPVLQITCRDRNRLSLQSELLSASVMGVENVLLLTGDHQTLGDHPGAMGVFDLDSVQLIAAAKKLESGTDLADKKLDGVPKFFKGAVVNPGADPLEPEIIKMEKKIAAGAEFFQTQAVYDIAQFKSFYEQVKSFNVPILAGIVFLKSAGMAKYMNKNVAGVNVPDELIAEIDGAEDKKEKSVEISARLVSGLKDCAQGIHLMPLGWDNLVIPVLDKVKL